MSANRKVVELLKAAGIEIDGGRPWDLQVHDERLYNRVLGEGSVGAGESYMDGWWDAEQLDEFFFRVQRARLDREIRTWSILFQVLLSRFINRQDRRRSKQVAEQHYDLSNRLYEAMLGPTMQYTCAYYGPEGEARALDEAQRAKLALVARKLHLKPGMRVLELGGGFGELARYLAAEHDCEVVSYNISRQQVDYARQICKGLPVDLRLQDYREAARDPGEYDRVVSVGLMEHVGPKNYRGFFELAKARLKAGGLALVHTIGGNESRVTADPWITKYIFPGGVIPSEAQLTRAKEGLFVLEDWHNFGPDYDRTLMAWEANFLEAWPELKESEGLDERFYRMWRYYLNCSAGAFRARGLNLWQLVLSHGDVPRYIPVR
ncbi:MULTISPECIES: cyclopropane fatty acyl phospholipid synthase [unclassified Wenzhouxiangella]|uniref:cyclopropane fatty acyl phospholipid synthase n=1 Tax=unclassified Wenzhouxiangella TaxID=2613841 RepID=UPI000E32A47C|nr:MULTISPECIES: cyclopropane fatty acyl phospholipid synthase [unclassified Wenzhouxiangella]RFF29000.1 cyclopropane fatty acyl phospholipid synthase [Wenzhouxiangella sp. 15181]RFP68294.1 cyclopropane fatty acyl phospholipid synthase [Wenzhouxiangella sp. 15190]